MPWKSFLKTCVWWWHATLISMPNWQPPTLHTSLFILVVIFIRKSVPSLWKDHHGLLPPFHQWKHPCDFTFSCTIVCTLGLTSVHWVKAYWSISSSNYSRVVLKPNFFHSWVVVVKVAIFIVVVSKKITSRFCVIIHCNGKISWFKRLRTF
jgi:hypothetical protein